MKAKVKEFWAWSEEFNTALVNTPGIKNSLGKGNKAFALPKSWEQADPYI